MTVASSTNRVSHLGNGSTTVFPFNIAFFAASDLQVYVGGVLQTLGTDYTLSGTAPYLSGSNVTFTVAPGASVPIVLVRVVPYTQLLDLVQNDSLPPEDLERRLDANVMMVQQIVEQQGRSFVIPVTDVTGTNVTLPNAAARANQALIFDGSGNVTIGALANAVISSAMQPVASAATISAARSAMGIVGRNKIINGKMDIYQRGSSFANPANAYTLDRWNYGTAGTTGVVTVSAQSDVPSSNEFQTSLRVLVTTADTTQDAGDVAAIWQRIEGTNARDLIGKTFTLSFWVRSAKTGIHCAYFKNSGLDRTYVMEYTVNTANTWEYKTVTVTGGLITAGTWNWTAGAGLEMGFTLMAGSSNRTSANAWQTGNFLATNNQVNVLDTVNNIFAITGVQLEEGSVATPFEHRLLGQELVLCQRYYETGFAIMETYGLLNGVLSMTPYFKAAKRTNPTVTVADNGSVWMTGAFSVPSVSADSFRLTRSKDGTSGHFIMSASWTANAEL